MINKDIKEAVQILEELIEKAISGEEVFITQNDIPIAKLVPLNTKKKYARKKIKAGSAKGLIEISNDFDESLDDFKNYME